MNAANTHPHPSTDLSDLDDEAFEIFMAELLAGLDEQRATQQIAGLPWRMQMYPVAA
jgi:hypothetical protein